MSYQFIKNEVENGIIHITLNRPEQLNVLTIPMMEELADAFKWAKTQSGAIVLLDAAGKAFSAGVDVADHTPDKVDSMIAVFDSIFHAMNEVEVPIVCAVNGAALGGGYELVLFSDMVVISEKAKLGQPEIQVGVFPPLASYMLPIIASLPNAYELLLSGDVIDAARADKLGLVNAVLPVDGFEAGVQAFCKKFVKLSPIVLAYTKKAIKAGLNKGFVEGLKAIDDIYLKELMPTADAKEGLQAFMEKRKPVWTGK